MTAAALLEIIQALLGAAPDLITLFDNLKSGTPVTAAQVQAVFTKYGVDRIQLLADIAAAQAKGV